MESTTSPSFTISVDDELRTSAVSRSRSRISSSTVSAPRIERRWPANTLYSVFAGHLRSILGALTVEELIRDRERLTAEVRSSSSTEMVKLGLVVDSMQIQEIDDASGYIVNLGKPHAAAVAAAARIAE